MPRPKTIRPYSLLLGGLLAIALVVLLIRGVAMQSDGQDKAQWEQAQNDLKILAETLSVYARETGGYPAKLDDLMARLGREVPRNPFNGQPYEYRLTSSGFSLVCLGKDETIGGALVPNADIAYTEGGLVVSEP
ncbi:MAG: type II secretion system protein GspG [Planctomycetes bacterium]|nr:type II secretion system protein GspG [Planctomycetota bacterium]